MRLKVPITGTVLDYDIQAAKYDGIGVVGDPSDPVRPINISLGNVSWGLLTIDLVNNLAEIEVNPAENISVLKAGGDPLKPEDWTSRQSTPTEKQGFLDHAKSQLESHTTDELYAMSKSKRLAKPIEAVEKYKKNPPNVAKREQVLAQG
jgi:hypothetical protein